MLFRELIHIAEAIDFLHRKNVAHRDVYLGNTKIFPKANGEITFKLADFGACKYFGQYGESENTEHQDGSRLESWTSSQDEIEPEYLSKERCFLRDWHLYSVHTKRCL